MGGGGFMLSTNVSLKGNRGLLRKGRELKGSKTSKLNKEITKTFSQEEVEAYKKKLYADKKREAIRNFIKMAVVSVVLIGIILFFVFR